MLKFSDKLKKLLGTAVNKKEWLAIVSKNPKEVTYEHASGIVHRKFTDLVTVSTDTETPKDSDMSKNEDGVVDDSSSDKSEKDRIEKRIITDDSRKLGDAIKEASATDIEKLRNQMQEAMSKDKASDALEETEFDMDAIKKLPLFHPTLPEINLLVDCIVRGIHQKDGDAKQEEVKELIELGFLEEIVYRQAIGHYAATARGYRFIIELYEVETIQEAIKKNRRFQKSLETPTRS